MSSHRQILRSTSIIGGSTVISMTAGLVKVKVLAVLLGPAGVGLMGLYQSILNTASTLFGCGLVNSGVRQLAMAEGEIYTLSLVRRSLFIANLLLGLLAMGLLWLMREPIARLVLGNTDHADKIGWIGLGVLLSLIATSQTALLQGMRRIGDLAKVNIAGVIAGSILGILAVWLQGQEGVIWFVLLAPAMSVMVGSWYSAKLPRTQGHQEVHQIFQQWQAMFSLGIPVMIGGLLTLFSQLAVRAVVTNQLGLDAMGCFQAAWAISMVYVGLLMNAMGTDYLPRLSAVVNDKAQLVKLVNEQAEMSLLFAGPILLGVLTFSPWIVAVLYTKNFAPAAEVLRWQVMGDMARVMSWPIGFLFLAMGKGRMFISTQLIWNLIYLICVWLGIAHWGLLTTGIGFFIASIVTVIVIRFQHGFLLKHSFSVRNTLMGSVLISCAVVIQLTLNTPTLVGYVISGIICIGVGGYSVWRLNILINFMAILNQRLGK